MTYELKGFDFCRSCNFFLLSQVPVDGTTNLCKEYSIKLKLSAIPVVCAEARLQFKTLQGAKPKVKNRVFVSESGGQQRKRKRQMSVGVTISTINGISCHDLNVF
jgi:hypothetical protein